MTAPACGSCTAPVPDGYLCKDCTRDLGKTLLLAASIAGDLDDAVARLLKRGDVGKSQRTEAPLPVDLAASFTASQLKITVTVWVGLICPRVPRPYGPICLTACDHGSCAWIWRGRGPVFEIAPMAVWLRNQLYVIRQHERAADAKRDITEAVHRAVLAIDIKPERVPAGHCEQCKAPLLAELGADEVTCSCGMLTTALMSKRRDRAAAADVLGTATEISGALAKIGITVSASTIRALSTRGRLTQRPGGVYALSDVLAWCAQRDAKVRG